MNKLYQLALVVMALELGLVSVCAAEKRLWRTQEGPVAEARLLSLSGSSVMVQDSQGKTMSLARESLSMDDQLYLAEYAGADTKTILKYPVKKPFSAYKFNPASIKSLPDGIAMDGIEVNFNAWESEHFLLISDLDKPNLFIIEMAERLWHESAFFQPKFSTDWGQKRRVIFLIAERQVDLFSAWGESIIEDGGKELGESLLDLSRSPKDTGALTAWLPSSFIAEHGLTPVAVYFQDASSYFKKNAMKKGLMPQYFYSRVINLIFNGQTTESLITYSLSELTLFELGYRCAKMMDLKKDITAEDLELTLDTTHVNFNQPEKWGRSLKEELKSGKVKISLSRLLKLKFKEANALDYAVSYAFYLYNQQNLEKVLKYARMMRQINIVEAVPGEQEFARIFGFQNLDELDKDFTKFILSSTSL
jgi:hypothetical protein